jgi:hypothetical protein
MSGEFFYAATVAATNLTFSLGGDLEVFRVGFGAMRITGPGLCAPTRKTS